jgi:hypothetical protein
MGSQRQFHRIRLRLTGSIGSLGVVLGVVDKVASLAPMA